MDITEQEFVDRYIVPACEKLAEQVAYGSGAVYDPRGDVKNKAFAHLAIKHV